MKKNLLTKIVALGLAVVTAFTPVTASAAEKKVVTREEVDAALEAIEEENMELIEEDESPYCQDSRRVLNAANYNYIKTLNGCYQENGVKIYTVLNNGKKTFKKTGTYSIIAGGLTAKKDQGRVYFKAPKAGTYKFTMVAKTNVVGGAQCNDFYRNSDRGYTCKLKYYVEDKLTTNTDGGKLLLADPAKGGTADKYRTGSPFDGNVKIYSKMTKITITYKMTKGETVEFNVRSSDADLYEEDYQAGNFVGMDLTIKKIK